ncbi:MAG: site-2 protease family protein [Chloroflexota bacterium]
MFFNLTPELILINLIAVGLGMTIHEFAHNYVGHLAGDPVPASEGRLTLNPLVHINWVGWLMFAIIGFGILGSAPISARRMDNPRWGFLAAVAAGPISNLLLAIVFAIPVRIMYSQMEIIAGLQGQGNIITMLFVQVVYWNVLLAVFNLIPLYPIDGWHIVYSLLPPDLAYRWGSPQWIQYSQYAFFGAIFLSIAGILPIFSWLIGTPTTQLLRLMLF